MSLRVGKNRLRIGEISDRFTIVKPLLYKWGLHQQVCGEMAELAEGARLLSEYGVKSSTMGSNPILSAIFF